MSDNRRDQFIARVSTVGWGTRESIQVLLGAVVSDVREGVVRGTYSDAELDVVVDFHDRAEDLWRDTIATNPPIPVDELATRLRDLIRVCNADPALAEFAQRLERGLRDAEDLNEAKKQN
jgi:hypothetical protein